MTGSIGEYQLFWWFWAGVAVVSPMEGGVLGPGFKVLICRWGFECDVANEVDLQTESRLIEHHGGLFRRN